jgi:hypothetical protein
MSSMKVYQAINAVQSDLAAVGITKDRRNSAQGYNFRGIDDCYNAISPLLAKHHLVIIPRMMARTCEERPTKNNGVLFYVTVEAEFDFVSSDDGSKHVARTFGEAMDSADKATNKAMSAAYKYVVMQAFAIPTEGDNDADAHTPEPAARQVQQNAAGKPQNQTGQNMSQVANQADELAKMKEAMIADIRSEMFINQKAILHDQIKKAIGRLTKPDQDDVWAEWVKRRDSLIDPTKSRQMADTLTNPLTFADKDSDYVDMLAMIETNKDKLTTADYKTAKAKVEEAKKAFGTTPQQAKPNPLTANMTQADDGY